MSKTIAKAHDRFFKELFSRPTLIRSFVEGYLDPAVSSAFDPDSLEIDNSTFVRARPRITSKHRGRRGARPARSEEGEYIDVFNRRATLRAGMDRRPNAEVILGRALREASP